MEKYQAVEILWNYLKVNDDLKKSDAIIVFGNHDTQVADRGIELFFKNYAPLIVFTGGFGRITSELWNESEADKFAKIAINKGIPENKIIIENKSTNTGDNIIFTKEKLEAYNCSIKSIIAVHQPYMERRIFAAIKKNWTNIDVLVTSPQKNFQEYCYALFLNEKLSEDDIINIMVGDFQRVDEYFKKGFQIYQEIPKNAWEAYCELVCLGYDKHVIK